jgi:hypothetical protein
MGTEALTSKPGDVAAAWPIPAPLDRRDALNVALLLVAFVLVLLVVPPGRSYPVIDDWIYGQSVQRLLALDYRPHDYALTSALGHLVWGAVFVWLFGFSFSVLTAANLIISAACLGVFYLLLRQTGIAPGYALFGTALLGCNPIYLHLSYSYMTDITFMLYVLAACTCYIKGAVTDNSAWLWAGGGLSALGYLTRQPGVLVAVAALFYLWWVRQLSARTALATALLPALAVAAFMVWERTQLVPLVSYTVDDFLRGKLEDPWGAVVTQAQRLVLVAPALGWALLPLLTRARKAIMVPVVFTGFVFFLIRGVTIAGTMFPEFGNVVDRTGFVMYEFNALPVWNIVVWSLIALLGTFILSVFIVSCGERVVEWVRSRPWRGAREADPTLLLYVTAALIGLLTIAAPYLYDRYLLPLVPLLMVPALRTLQVTTIDRVQAWRWASVLVLLLFFVIAQTDHRAKATARWEAAEGIVAQGVLPEHVIAGFEWTGWMYYEKAVAYVRQSGTTDLRDLVGPTRVIEDAEYMVSEVQVEGYDVIRRLLYNAWLEGGQERAVLVLKRR